MSKFITPVTMKVTEEQFENDLKQPLLDLGYNNEVGSCESDFTKYNYLTNVKNSNTIKVGNNIFMFNKVSGNHIKNYNPELYLALAAMTEGEDWTVGEWLVVKDVSYLPSGTLFKVKELKNASYEDGFAGNDIKHLYRKATKEELIKHFSKESKETTTKQNRFPFTLNKESFLKLMCAACGDWRNKLVNKWGSELLLNNTVDVTEDFYRQILEACNVDQIKVMDEVFGKDVKAKPIEDLRECVIDFLVNNGMTRLSAKDYVTVNDNTSLSLKFICANIDFTNAIAKLFLKFSNNLDNSYIEFNSEGIYMIVYSENDIQKAIDKLT